MNLLTGLGDEELDHRLHTVRRVDPRRTVQEYEDEWRENAYARREVSQVSGDIFREGVELINVKPDTIDLSNLKSWLEGDTTPRPDGSIDRTYGLLYYAEKVIETGDKCDGAALFPVLDDGLDPAQPLDWRRIQRVVGWVVFDRSELIPYVHDGMGTEPEYWMLADVMSSAIGLDGKYRRLRPGQVIHASRLWRHKGVELSGREERRRQWWGASVLDLNWHARRGIELSTDYANTYAHRASWVVLTMAELNEMYGATDDDGNVIGRQLVAKRVRDFRRDLSTLGIGLLDGGKQGTKAADAMTEESGRPSDSVQSISESVADLPAIWELNRGQWQSGFGAPRSIAFGEQASALRGGDNKGDWQSWQGSINLARKKKRVNELVNWMLTITFASREGPTRGLIPTQWELFWHPLVVPTALEKASIDKARAEADNARIEKGVVTPEEVREQRFVQGDVEGPLRLGTGRDGEDTEVTAPPAQVGIAQSMLSGAMAVAKGEVSMEFFAAYLQAIDPQRFPPAVASDMARRAALARVSGPDEGQPTSEDSSLPAATVPAVPSAPAVPAVPAVPGAETVDAELPDDDRTPDEPEKADPFAVLADIPDDLMTPAQIVEEIQRRTQISITTRHVHALAKKHQVRSGKVGGVRGYSANDIAMAIARDNGSLPDAEPESDVDPGDSEDGPRRFTLEQLHQAAKQQSPE